MSGGFTLTEEMTRLVEEQRLAFVATVCPDGTPNLSPKGTTTVWDDRHLVFADIRSPGTVENLRHNPAVEVNVVDPVLRKGFRFKGMGKVLTEGSEYARIVRFFEEDRGLNDAGRRIRSIVLIEVRDALPLISPAYDMGLTEQEVAARWWEHWERLWELRTSEARGDAKRSPQE